MFTHQVTPDRGRCLVATSHIKQGTIVIKEYPFVVAEDVYDALYRLYDSENDGDGDDSARQLFENLAPHKMDKYVISYEDIMTELETVPEYIRDTLVQIPKDRLRLYVAKFYRNAFTYPSPPCALLALGSIMNHSCDNNIDFEVDRNGNYIFKANRDIYAGEELCDSYLQTYKSTKKRKDCLLYQYGFVCQCIKCHVDKQ